MARWLSGWTLEGAGVALFLISLVVGPPLLACLTGYASWMWVWAGLLVMALAG